MQFKRTLKKYFYNIKTKAKANYYQDIPISKTMH